jgi:arginase
MQDIICIGAPFWMGELPEYESAVNIIRRSGFADRINANWFDIRPDYAAHFESINAVNHAITQTIKGHPNRFPVVFAGDCMCALGVVNGLDLHKLGVVWYDAHGDFNTRETSPSGFLGGMPLAMLVGRGDQTFMQDLKCHPIKEQDIILTDARNLDDEEAAALAESNVRIVRDVNDMLTVDLPKKPFYIHVDMDVINGDELPAMAYPEKGGPSVDEVAQSLKRVARDGEVAGLLLTVWDYSKDGESDLHLNAALKLTKAVINGMRHET